MSGQQQTQTSHPLIVIVIHETRQSSDTGIFSRGSLVSLRDEAGGTHLDRVLMVCNNDFSRPSRSQRWPVYRAVVGRGWSRHCRWTAL